MVRFDGRILAVALPALLLRCGRESRQPERPAADPQAERKKTPKDSGGDSQTYPWQSGPIAAL